MNDKTDNHAENSGAAKPARPIGRVVFWLGLILAAGFALDALVSYSDIARDASVRAFAPLVLIEGAFFVVVGLFIAVLGARSSRSEKSSAKAPPSAGDAKGESDRSPLTAADRPPESTPAPRE